MSEQSSPLTLEEIARELLTAYAANDFLPGHRCSDDCTHEQYIGLPLVPRLRGLVQPGTTPVDGSGIRSGGRKGSPAPWDPRAGELLDEMARGAVEYSREVRHRLGLSPLRIKYATTPPGWHPPLALHVVSASLEDVPLSAALLPGLRDTLDKLPLLAARRPDHWLVQGPLIVEARPEHGHLPGAVEAALRRWHRRALIVAGFVSPPVVLRQIANPEHGKFRPGPLCRGCRHESCVQLSLSRKSLWITARCPYCGAMGIHQDPESGTLFCARPSCRDEDGERHSWSLDSLRRLGLLQLREANA